MPPRKQESTEVYISLKHGRTTTFVLTSLITPFSTIITDLLSGLFARYPDGIPSGPEDDAPKLQIPANAYQIRLAKLHDNTNSDKGWSEIPWLKHEDDKLKNCLRAWGVEGAAKLAFAFAKDEAEVEKIRDISDAEEEKMVAQEAPEFWVEWPNFEWMDREAEDDEEMVERLSEEDGDGPVRVKRRRIVDDGEDEDDMDGQLKPQEVADLADEFKR